MNVTFLVARKNKGLTQEKLASDVGCNHADINRIEKHEWTPPPTLRKKLAKILGLPEAQLFALSLGKSLR